MFGDVKWTHIFIMTAVLLMGFQVGQLHEISYAGTTKVTQKTPTVTSGSSVNVVVKPKQAIKPLPLDKTFEYFKGLKAGEVSLYVKDLQSGSTYNINGNYVNSADVAGMNGASVVKLFMAYYLIQELDAGNLDWDKVYTDPVDKRKFTIRKEFRRMVVDSNNGSFNTFLRFVTPKAVNEGLASYGLKHTHIYGEIGPASDWSLKNNVKRYGSQKSSRINATEAGIILEKIYNKKSEKNMKVLHDYLFLVKNRERIPKALGSSYKVAHKTGTVAEYGIYNDVGIIYGKNGNYIICVLTAKQKSSVNIEIREAVRNTVRILEKRNRS